ncbi:NAD(P)-binding domain-containing protein [Denitromonas sp. IR12]|uniref:NAD(P)-binding domain-containing protein n=1 Tax=Denitromonas iodatirespirans TaxID=2795389 RepID=A0A944H6R4_DENI1|nr:NAD(P)-binding domain-containing protein [Denitromonas iodatirespirans]
MNKHVVIIGTGNVGTALARGFSARGDRVVFASRAPQGEAARQALDAVPGSAAGTLAETLTAADIVCLAVPGSALEAVLAEIAPVVPVGTLVIDATNPLDFSQGAPRLALGFSDSAGEAVQRRLPAARVVKAFNSIGAGLFVRPAFTGGAPDMFIAGNDSAAKDEVAAILRDFGWRGAIDVGAIDASRLLEPLAMLWIDYGVRRGHWTHGFSLLGQAA